MIKETFYTLVGWYIKSISPRHVVFMQICLFYNVNECSYT